MRFLDRDDEKLLLFDSMVAQLSAEHPDWDEERLLVTAVRLVAFDLGSRAEQELSDARFYRHNFGMRANASNYI